MPFIRTQTEDDLNSKYEYDYQSLNKVAQSQNLSTDFSLSEPFFSMSNIITLGILPAATLLLIVLAPLVLFTWVIHLFERLMEQRLVRRFGWNSVLVTGWLGTPIHELSHAIMCAIFQHEIVEMELFKPDKESGRLGYVVHTWQRGNRYQEIGSFFIGIAPLIGGAAILLLLLTIFFPSVSKEALFSTSVDLPVWQQVGSSLKLLFTGLFQASNIASLRLWLFLYLVICVGCHMGPSHSDYRGGLKGGLMLLVLLVVGSLAVALFLALFGPETSTLMSIAKPVAVPLLTGMIAVLILCGIATSVVFILTELVERFR